MAAADSPQTSTSAAAILHTLDYIAVDYRGAVANGAVLNADEYAEQQEFAAQLVRALNELPAAQGKAALAQRGAALVDAIATKARADAIAVEARKLATDIALAYDVTTAPRSAPRLADGQALFATHCAACHGAEGRGDGAGAVGLDPKPANFHDIARQSQRSVFSLYSTIRLGVDGTGMRGFAELDDEQVWALAFYVSNFLASDDQRQHGQTLWQRGEFRDRMGSLAHVTTAIPADVVARDGADAVDVLLYLRSVPAQAVTATRRSAFDEAREKLDAAASAYQGGDATAAYDSAVAAYLQGFELVESQLSAVAPALRESIEVQMRKLRSDIKAGAATEQIVGSVTQLQGQLREAQDRLQDEPLSALASAFSAFVVLVREGFEAILVLAAVAAFLVKTQRRAALPYVHAGWLAALVLGVLTWFAATRIIDMTGASREITEGVTGLVAAVMLIYVGYWLHSSVNSQRWQLYLKEKLHGVGVTKGVWPLVFVCFVAVYREVFETIMFLQTLWLQGDEHGRSGVWWGAAVAVLALAGLAIAVLRLSMRLPLGAFFAANAVILVVLSVIFAGKGIAAFQEAGVLAVHPVHFIRIDLLGVFPDALSLLGQSVFLVVAGLLFWVGRRNSPAATRP
jgi:high-affinity iron transporter